VIANRVCRRFVEPSVEAVLFRCSNRVVGRLLHACSTGFVSKIMFGDPRMCCHFIFLPFCKNVFPFQYLILVVVCSWYSCSTGSGCAVVVGLDVYVRSKFILTFVLLGGRQYLFDFRLP
jgi:hypothetical protein